MRRYQEFGRRSIENDEEMMATLRSREGELSDIDRKRDTPFTTVHNWPPANVAGR